MIDKIIININPTFTILLLITLLVTIISYIKKEIICSETNKTN